jgi:ribose 5-phosphate isomerase B
VTARKLFVGADHGGYELKEKLVAWLRGEGHDVGDFGTHSADAVDFPDFALLVAQAVAGNRAAGGDAAGIVIDAIGQGSAIVCNKVPGIRAVAGFGDFAVRSSREHNDANVLCLGGQVLGWGVARALVTAWLATPYAGGRHQARVDKIAAVERRFAKG